MLRPVLFAVVLIASAVPAAALEPRQLAGWWIAIDDTFPELSAKRGVAAMEEILVVGQDGRVEDRAMNFTAGSAKTCAETRVCGDALLIATARAQLKGDKLSFAERRDGATVDARGNAVVRKAVITATPAWSVAAKGDQITLRSGGTVRTLARIDPDRLRRLRAGLRLHPAPGPTLALFPGQRDRARRRIRTVAQSRSRCAGFRFALSAHRQLSGGDRRHAGGADGG